MVEVCIVGSRRKVFFLLYVGQSNRPRVLKINENSWRKSYLCLIAPLYRSEATRARIGLDEEGKGSVEVTVGSSRKGSNPCFQSLNGVQLGGNV